VVRAVAPLLVVLPGCAVIDGLTGSSGDDNGPTVDAAPLPDGPIVFPSFGTANDTPAECPNKIAVGRLDDDAHDDVAVVGCQGELLTIAGDGTSVQHAQPLPQASTFGDLVIADLDESGPPEIAMLASGQLVILQRTSAQPLAYQIVGSPLALGLNPWAIAAGDIDGDGHLDLAVTDFNTHGIIYYLQTGTSLVFTRHDVAGPGANLAGLGITDVDGDGKGDFFTGDPNAPGNVFQLHQNASSGFDVNSFTTGDLPWELAVGDVNGDAHDDVVAAITGAPEALWVMLANPSTPGAFLPAKTFRDQVNCTSVELGDGNGDALRDVVCSRDGVRVLLNDPTKPGTFVGSPDVFDVDQANQQNVVSDALVVDLDGDGKADLVDAIAGTINVVRVRRGL
jgi:hypothetical protein